MKDIVRFKKEHKKEHKIDCKKDYPCPCPRRGRLIPITLTEAFGCNSCQQIFVLKKEGYVLEQLPTHNPYKRSWRWDGHHWQKADDNFRESYLSVAILVSLMLLVIWLLLALQSPQGANIVPWVIFAVLLAIFPALMVWLAYRR